MTHTIESRARAYAKVKARRLQWFLENGPCVVCGSSENLELDHIVPEEKVSHNIWSWSYEKRIEELNKCQVLCHQCHLKKTSEWRASFLVCDGVKTSNYYKYKCRCEQCRYAANSKRSEKRARRLAAGLTRD